MKNEIFNNLFVLELANNHWGDVERGRKIIKEFSIIAHSNNIKAGIKLQIRDTSNFIHKDFKLREDIRYIKKTTATEMGINDFQILVNTIKEFGCIAMATPFDEKSVQTCVDLDIQILKIASSDIKDRMLIREIAKTKKPVIVSTAGADISDIDNIVNFFTSKNIPLAINHCVAKYPSKKQDLQLNKIDFLKKRYPDLVIGFSTHEYNDDIEIPIYIAYAKGARTFERHIDIDYNNIPVSPYCSLPKDIDKWIKAYFKAKEICGDLEKFEKSSDKDEIKYLDSLLRGVYAKKDIKIGDKLTDDNTYMAIPLQKGQISCNELIYGEVILQDIKKDNPIKIDDINSNYSNNINLKELIYNRGLSD